MRDVKARMHAILLGPLPFAFTFCSVGKKIYRRRLAHFSLMLICLRSFVKFPIVGNLPQDTDWVPNF